MTRRSKLLSTAVALAVTSVALPVAAQSVGIEEIVVTARKRAENLQDVPIVVIAFTADMIQQKGIADLDDIAKYTNGLLIDEGFSRGDTRVTLRGLSPTRGRQNVAILQDDVDISSLAISQAGGSFTINPRLIDVERIEVVKGPHSALYGRSAFNGAINYITKKPGDEVEMNAQVDLGTYSTGEARVSISGPVIPGKLSLGFNGAMWTFGGFYRSGVTGARLGGDDGLGAAGSFVFSPTEAVTFTGRVEYSQDDFDPDPRSMLNPAGETPQPAGTSQVVSGLNGVSFLNVLGTLGTADTFPDPRPSRNPRTGEDYEGATRDIFRTTLRAEVESDAVLFTSITHYGKNNTFTEADVFALGDAASTAVNALQETQFDTDNKLFSQEFRLQSNGDGPLTWLVGGLFWNEYVTQDSRSLVCLGASGGCAAVIQGTQTINGGEYRPRNVSKRETHHYSGFGMLEYAVTEQLKASVELRYTKEKEDTSGPATTGPSFLGCSGPFGAPGFGRTINAAGVVSCPIPGAPVLGPITASNFVTTAVESDFWAPRFTVDYAPTEDALLFASVALGKKPGGLSTLGSGLSNIPANTFLPEEMWVYEVGAKTEWLDNRLQLNGAVYYQDFSKKQVSVTIIQNNLPTTRVVNAAKAEVKGFEIDAVAMPTDNLTFTVGYTYNDAKYTDFTDISNSAASIHRAGNCTVIQVVTNATTGAMGNRCRLDYSGNRLEGAPKHNIQFGATITGDVSADTTWFLSTDVRHQSNRFTTFENALEIPAYTLVDLRLGMDFGDTLNITSYVENLFNDDHLKSNAVYLPNFNLSLIVPRSTFISGASALLPDKRQFGVRASYTF